MSLPKGQVKAERGLAQLVSGDVGQELLYYVEQVQAQAHYRRLGRVLKRLRRRQELPGWVHASDAQNPCLRVLGARLLGYRFRQLRSPQSERILENGNYVHLRWYNTFLSLPPPFQVEVAVSYREWPLVGEADVVIEDGPLGRLIVEIKSINSGEYKTLRAPKPDHIDQLNNYLGSAKMEMGLVWYENKDNQDVRPFQVDFDPSRYRAVQEKLTRVAAVVLEGRLPEACGSCDLDGRVADLKLDERRITALREEQSQWKGQ